MGKKTWSHTQTHVWGLAYVCLPLSVLEPFNLPVAILRRSLPHGERLAEAHAERMHCTDNRNLPSTWITVSGRPQTVRSHNRI